MRLLGGRGWYVTALMAFTLTVQLRPPDCSNRLNSRHPTRARACSRMKPIPTSSSSASIPEALPARSLALAPAPSRETGLATVRCGAEPRLHGHRFQFPVECARRRLLQSSFASWSANRYSCRNSSRPPPPRTRRSTHSRPLDRFLPYVQLVAVNRRPGDDGLERSWRSSWRIDRKLHRSIIDPEGKLPPETEVPIDFSISPASLTYISYVDLLEGRVAPATLAGKTVFVGATAVELGDMVPVPVYKSLPGVVVQALALESVRAGPLRVAPDGLSWLPLPAGRCSALSCCGHAHGGGMPPCSRAQSCSPQRHPCICMRPIGFSSKSCRSPS